MNIEYETIRPDFISYFVSFKTREKGKYIEVMKEGKDVIKNIFEVDGDTGTFKESKKYRK